MATRYQGHFQSLIGCASANSVRGAPRLLATGPKSLDSLWAAVNGARQPCFGQHVESPLLCPKGHSWELGTNFPFEIQILVDMYRPSALVVSSWPFCVSVSRHECRGPDVHIYGGALAAEGSGGISNGGHHYHVFNDLLCSEIVDAEGEGD